MADVKTHYDNLKVSRSASDSGVRAAYRKLAQKYHPDKFRGSQAEANRIMRILNDAKATLLDPGLRREYDLQLREREKDDRFASRQPRAQRSGDAERTWAQWRAQQAESQRRARAAYRQSAPAADGVPPGQGSTRRRDPGSGVDSSPLFTGAGSLIRALCASIGGATLFLFRRGVMAPFATLGPIAALVVSLVVAVFLWPEQGGDVLHSPAQAAAVYTRPPNPLSEVKPTLGFDLDRSPEQIRYCLSEDIRVEAIKTSLDRSSQFETDRFNSALSDYNSLCLRYSYRPATYEIVKSDVAAHRSTLVAEGLARLKAWRRLAATPTTLTAPGHLAAPAYVAYVYSPGEPPAVDMPGISLPPVHLPSSSFFAGYTSGLEILAPLTPSRHWPTSGRP